MGDLAGNFLKGQAGDAINALLAATGHNMRMILILRRDMPRKTDITNYSVCDIDEITWAVNSTPR